jgi:hypothetical protein
MTHLFSVTVCAFFFPPALLHGLFHYLSGTPKVKVLPLSRQYGYAANRFGKDGANDSHSTSCQHVSPSSNDTETKM